MYQEITLSSNLFKYLDENQYNQHAPESDPVEVIKNIRLEKKWFVDKLIFQPQVEVIIKNSVRRGALNGVWRGLIQLNRINKINIGNTTISEKQISDTETRRLSEIANKYGDHILLTESLKHREIKVINGKLHVSCYSFKEYLNPPNDSDLLQSKKRLQFQGNEEFDIKKFFKPYLKNSRTLVIEDPFFSKYKKNSGFYVFKTLLKLCSAHTKVTLRTVPINERGNLKDTHEDLHKSAKSACPKSIQLKIEEISAPTITEKMHDRKIETDDWIIDIGKGLDFAYRQPLTGIVIANKGVINVNAKNQNI